MYRDTGRYILIAIRHMLRDAIKTARMMDDVHDRYKDNEQYLTARHTVRDYWHIYRVAMSVRKDAWK